MSSPIGFLMVGSIRGGLRSSWSRDGRAGSHDGWRMGQCGDMRSVPATVGATGRALTTIRLRAAFHFLRPTRAVQSLKQSESHQRTPGGTIAWQLWHSPVSIIIGSLLRTDSARSLARCSSLAA